MYIDLLTRIVNAQRARKEFVKVMYSNFDLAIAELLAGHHYVAAAAKKGRLPKRVIEITLTYDDSKKGAIQGIKFLSKPSRRHYVGYRDLRPVKQGYGIAVISTPKGVMTTKEARKQKLGGELLFEMW